MDDYLLRTNGRTAAEERLKSLLRAPARPALALGAGAFGRAVVELLDGAPQRPATLYTSWVGPCGWHFPGPDAAGDPPLADAPDAGGPWPGRATWWAEHGALGAAALEAQLLAALQALPALHAGREDIIRLPLYLIIDWMEAGARDLWLVLAEQLHRAVDASFADYELVLLLGTNARAIDRLDGDAGAALTADLDALAALLRERTTASGLHIDWCWLFDTHDVRGHPLLPLLRRPDAPRSLGAADVLALRAAHAAEWLLTLACGLQTLPPYRRTALAEIQHDLGLLTPTAWAGAVGVASAYVPVDEMATCATLDLALRVFDDYLLRPEQPGDRARARVRRDRWLADRPIQQAVLRQQLARTATGEPLLFDVEPPDVAAIPDPLLPGYLADWDSLLWQRWQSPAAPPAHLAANADGIIAAQRDWLAAEIDRVVAHEPAGTTQALLLLDEAQQAIEQAVARGEAEPPAEEHWLAALLAPLQRAEPDPTALPDVDGALRELARRLPWRLNRRAVFARATLWAVVTLVFVWAAYALAGPALGGAGWLAWRAGWSARLGVPAAWFDLAVLATVLWSFWLLVGMAQIAWSDRAIMRATEAVIAAMRQKYAALRERALRAERERIYNALLRVLAEQRQAVLAQQARLREARAALAAAAESDAPAQPFALPLLPATAWRDFAPAPDAAELSDWVGAWLRDGAQAAWQTQPPAAIARAVRGAATARLADWRAQLPATVLRRDLRLADVLQRLLATVRPTWPLALTDRRSVQTDPLRGWRADGDAAEREPVLRRAFLLVPAAWEAHVPQMADVERLRAPEAARLTLAETLPAMALDGLRLWEKVARPADLEVVL